MFDELDFSLESDGGKKKILRKLRFIDLVIMYVKIIPLAPIIVPVMTRIGAFILNPTSTVAQPEREFNIEMIIGISAPPIGDMKKKPNKIEVIDIKAMKEGRVLFG